MKYTENYTSADIITGNLCFRTYTICCFSGFFKGLKQCNVEATYGLVKWEDNWIAFMDKMLQIKVLQTDTRLLYVPVSLDKIIINPMEHLEAVARRKEVVKVDDPDKEETKEILMPLYADIETNMIR